MGRAICLSEMNGSLLVECGLWCARAVVLHLRRGFGSSAEPPPDDECCSQTVANRADKGGFERITAESRSDGNARKNDHLGLAGTLADIRPVGLTCRRSLVQVQVRPLLFFL